MSFAPYHDELIGLMKKYTGETFKAAQIKSLFENDYPHLKVEWLSPSDHCENHTCKGACYCSMTEKSIFRRVSHGVYEVR